MTVGVVSDRVIFTRDSKAVFFDFTSNRYNSDYRCDVSESDWLRSGY